MKTNDSSNIWAVIAAPFVAMFLALVGWIGSLVGRLSDVERLAAVQDERLDGLDDEILAIRQDIREGFSRVLSAIERK